MAGPRCCWKGADLQRIRPEKRYLPSLAEWGWLGLVTRKCGGSSRGSKMMSAATRTHLAQLSWAAAFLAAVLAIGWGFMAGIEPEAGREEPIARLPAPSGRVEPSGRRACSIGLAAGAVVGRRRRPCRRPLAAARRAFARIALAQHDEAGVPGLVDDLLSASPQQLEVICGALEPWRGQAVPLLWSKLGDAPTGADGRLCAACALAQSDPASPHWTEVAPSVAEP